MIKQFTLSELYAHGRERPTGESILDELIPLIHRYPGLSANSIAKYLHVNLRNLSGTISIYTGQPLNTLLNQWKMYKALELLRTTDLPFATIAITCGYRQYKNLARAMKRQLKMTPFEYRNGYRRTVQRPVNTPN